jgi:hypothetical protein
MEDLELRVEIMGKAVDGQGHAGGPFRGSIQICKWSRRSCQMTMGLFWMDVGQKP